VKFGILYNSGMPHKYVKSSLERFAKYGMPHFRNV
jgi:hypothetical protein